MIIFSCCITDTSPESLDWLEISINSYCRYHNDIPTVYCDGDKELIRQRNIKCKIEDISIYRKVNKNFNLTFTFDIHTLFLSEINFNEFEKSSFKIAKKDNCICTKQDYNNETEFFELNEIGVDKTIYNSNRFYAFIFKTDLKKVPVIPSSEEWTKPYYDLLRKECLARSIQNKVPFAFKKIVVKRNFKVPKVAFYSTITGNVKKYCNFAKVTMQSYSDTNSMDITWIITSNTNEELEQAKQILTDYKHISLDFMLLPKTKGIDDYSLYNQNNWVNDFACKLFTDRIAFVDCVQDNYDVLVCVDFDIIFRKDISKYLLDFFNSPYKLGGQTEYNFTEYYLRKRGVENIDNHYLPKYYVNFGFGMLHCRNLHKNHWDTFLKISKGHEEYFGCQEQLYFAISCNGALKHYDDLQLLIYNRLNNQENAHYRLITTDTPLIHFTPSKYLYDEFSDTESPFLLGVLVTFFDEYYDRVKQTKGLDEDFIERIKSNAQKIKVWNQTHSITKLSGLFNGF